MGYKVGIVGATGVVGQYFIQILKEKLWVDALYLAASEQSKGKTIENLEVRTIKELYKLPLDLVFFSAGKTISLQWAKRFAKKAVVIDNSSAWRLKRNVPLIVPEINCEELKPHHRLIANPNCSTIQLALVLHALKPLGLQKVVVSTYQSASGAGMQAIEQLAMEILGWNHEKVLPTTLFLNCIPQCGAIDHEGYSEEEQKIHKETRKILRLPRLAIHATAVRVPTLVGHGESVWIRFRRQITLEEVRSLLEQQQGIRFYAEGYPTPRQLLGSKDIEVHVGRLRRDLSDERAIGLWIVADNLVKGAAGNAVQIAEYLIEQQWL